MSNTKYSILIPTYNERENISLLIYLIDKILTQKYIYINSKLVILYMKSSSSKTTVPMAHCNV